MNKEEFLKKVALTLEMSIKMAEGWLERIKPEDEEEKRQLEEHKQNLHSLLAEIADFTSESHARRVELEESVKAEIEEIQGAL